MLSTLAVKLQEEVKTETDWRRKNERAENLRGGTRCLYSPGY